MPTYSYACTECDNRFDAVQAFSDDALTTCEKCSGRLRKLFGSVGVVFKGSGFYRNDSRESAKSSSNGSAKSSSSSSSEAVQLERHVQLLGEVEQLVREVSSSEKSDSSSSTVGRDHLQLAGYPQAAVRRPHAIVLPAPTVGGWAIPRNH